MAKTIEKNFGPGKTEKPFIVLEFGGKYPDDDVIRDYLKKVGMAVYEQVTHRNYIKCNLI